MATNLVVVGVDGTPESLSAAEFAAGEAVSRGLPLQLVHAVRTRAGEPPPESASRAAQVLLDHAEARARAAAPGVMTTTMIVAAEPTIALAKASHNAALLVVGRRWGPVAKIRSTSVVARIARYAPCSVIVTQGVFEPTANVVVGVDASPTAPAALEFGFAQARLHRVGLTAIHAFQRPASELDRGDGYGIAARHDAQAAAARVLDDALTGWASTHADVMVHRMLIEGSAKDALVQASTYARILVVGAPPAPHAQTSTLPAELIRHAMCPVAIARSAPHALIDHEVIRTQRSRAYS